MTNEEFKGYYWRQGGSRAHRRPLNRWFDWHDEYGNVCLRGRVVARMGENRFVVSFFDEDDLVIRQDVATSHQFYVARCRFYRTYEEMRAAG